ncbi:hypothetical protein [Caulobacter endophyticus]|uniref:hypothetical protein n=1 Tax=Caulobacter endophyticus TaxID=2172652 RepID=UPI00240E9FBF|nr:hypothetical protein [Caulobacter endophyticus]MDG2531543.1 hypothetical protein [Caulobacter endophyticus]
MGERFSRRCVIAAIDVLEGAWRHADFTAFLMELGPSIYQLIRTDQVSLKNRMSDLKGVFDQDPTAMIDGEPLARVLVERAVSKLPGEPKHSWSPPVQLTPAMETFKRTLEMDGYTVTDGVLRRILPADIGLPETESELLRLLDVYQLHTAKGHLRQAMDTHARGDWAAANGQLRTFFDALLDSLADRVDPNLLEGLALVRGVRQQLDVGQERLGVGAKALALSAGRPGTPRLPPARRRRARRYDERMGPMSGPDESGRPAGGITSPTTLNICGSRSDCSRPWRRAAT